MILNAGVANVPLPNRLEYGTTAAGLLHLLAALLALVLLSPDPVAAEDEGGKWKPRPTPTRDVAEIVRERTSPAVKAALRSLLDAATPSTKARGRVRAARKPARVVRVED